MAPNLDLKKDILEFFFQVSTILFYIFAWYIQNLEMHFAIVVYFDFGYVWVELR